LDLPETRLHERGDQGGALTAASMLRGFDERIRRGNSVAPRRRGSSRGSDFVVHVTREDGVSTEVSPIDMHGMYGFLLTAALDRQSIPFYRNAGSIMTAQSERKFRRLTVFARCEADLAAQFLII